MLQDMIGAFSPEVVTPVVLFYQDNPVARELRRDGVEVLDWEEIRRREVELALNGSRLELVAGMVRSVARRMALLRQFRIDLVHLNNSPRTGHTTWLPAARWAGIPIVASARGDADPFPARGLRGAVHRGLMHRMDRVLCISHYIAEAYRRQGFSPDRVEVVHDGVRAELPEWVPTRSRAQVRAEFGVPEGVAMATMVGNVRHWKGQHVVLEALRELEPPAREGVVVVFVGAVRDVDSDYFAGLQDFVAEHGLEPCVRFVGGRTDVPDILCASDLAIHASVIPEPAGLVILEAMTLGVPVICASQGGGLDYWEEGAGLLHDVERPSELADAIRTLVTDPETRRRMGERSRTRARGFSIQRTVDRIEAVYRELVDL